MAYDIDDIEIDQAMTEPKGFKYVISLPFAALWWLACQAMVFYMHMKDHLFYTLKWNVQYLYIQ